MDVLNPLNFSEFLYKYLTTSIELIYFFLHKWNHIIDIILQLDSFI